MIKLLTQKHKQQILKFCYQNERENIFVISSFTNHKNPFSVNKYWGYFRRNKLIGLAVFFGRFGNFVINAEDKNIINKLVDHGVRQKINIEFVAAFQKYAKTTIARLKTHKIKPKESTDEIVLILAKETFKDFSTGKEQIATKKDIEELILFEREMGFQDDTGTITDRERKRVIPMHNFLIKFRNKIISKANIHGYTKNYFQIGGVGTTEKQRSKGHAKKVVSKLCKCYFNRRIPYALLFTAKDNIPAQKVYKQIGFNPVDKFIIARY